MYIMSYCLQFQLTLIVKKTVPKRRDAYMAHAHRDILNFESYAYVYCAYESKLSI